MQLTRWRKLLATGGQALLDLFFPPRCAGCSRIGAFFCDACRAQVETIQPPVCGRCGRPVLNAGLCADCQRRPSHLDTIISAVFFAGPLRAAIHSLKYANCRDLGGPLSTYLVDAWRRADLTADRIVPVPLHPSRLSERGYNQSALLARGLAEATGVQMDETLVVRQRATQQQALLNAAARRENVKDAFTCQGHAAGLQIALVDDVCTTGSTLEACAAALRAGGAAGVWALTLARARWSPHDPNVPARDG